MKYPYASTFLISLGLLVAPACSDDTTAEGETGTGTGTETGDGDGDPAGDGDGDTAGDGDGDTAGDGDGDTAGDGDGDTAGDGDGDTAGDGDGDTAGDGDGDTAGDGDGDTAGDGDGDMTGDGDGDMTGDGDGDMAEDDTIYACQDGTIMLDEAVDVDGVWVTAILANGFFAQEEAGGENSGIWVFVGDMGPDISELVIGELVDIEGTLVDFGGIDELDASMGTVVEVGALDPIPMPNVITAADLAPMVGEPWESVYVRLEGMPLSVTVAPVFNEFVVSDGDPAIIDDYIYNLPADGGMDFPNFGLDASFTAIQGIVNFSFDNFKIAPRFVPDFEGYIEAPPPPFVGVNDLVPGDLVITEIMFNPNACSDNFCEWIEIFNASGEEVNLQGLIIGDASMNTGLIAEQFVLADGDYALLGRTDAMDWGYMLAADAYYGANPAYNNGGDLAKISNDNEDIDITDTYVAGAAGTSVQLDANSIDAASNDDFANWCYSTDDFEGDLGTPGAANNPCN